MHVLITSEVVTGGGRRGREIQTERVVCKCVCVCVCAVSYTHLTLPTTAEV